MCAGVNVTIHPLSAQVIHTFSGIRAKSSRGDWIIEESSKAAGFINVAGRIL